MSKFISSIKNFNPESVTVYSNDFDLSMFKLFFPDVKSDMKYLQNSIGFNESYIPDDFHEKYIIRNWDEKNDKHVFCKILNKKTQENFTYLECEKITEFENTLRVEDYLDDD
jgi:hypothetical protein